MPPDPTPDPRADDPAEARSDGAAVASVALPALAGAVAVGVAATGAGLLLPGAELSDAAADGVRVGGAALALDGLLALVTRWGRAARVPARDLAAVLVGAAVVMAGVTALTFAFSQATITAPDPSTTTTTSTTRETTTTERDTPTTTTEQDEVRDGEAFDLVPLLSALVLAGVLALVVYALVRVLRISPLARWRRAAAPLPHGTPGSLDVAAAEAGLEASLDAVTGDLAPRDAISDAYARLLAALAEAGAGRRTHEAPHEHLHRVLTPLGVRSEPLHRLAGLFVLARFSQHPVTAAHRDEASDALRTALADLRATQARRTPQVTA